jgi:multicomponent Na+:H+ antiporter subunit F
MESFFLYYCLLLLVVVFVPLYRVVAGPTLFDRMLGAGTIATSTLALILVIGFLFKRFDMFVDIAMAYAALNFIGNITIAKYLGSLRGGRET